MTSCKNTSPWYAKRSSFTSNVRVMGWIHGFVNNSRKQSNKCDDLTMEEIQTAKMCVFKLVQQDSFQTKNETQTRIGGLRVLFDKDGTIRIKTKLLNREDTELFRLPILLPKNHVIVDQFVREVHQKHNHAGIQTTMGILREEIWILQTRRKVKEIVHKCVTCRRFTAQSYDILSAPLPNNRTKNAKTFQTTGVDLAGPERWNKSLDCAFHFSSLPWSAFGA